MSLWTVIFDFDGVIADTLPALYGIYGDFLAAYGHRGCAEEFDRLNGPSLREIIQYLKRTYTLPGTEDALLDEYTSALGRVYSRSPLVPQMASCIRSLQARGVRLRIGTSSRREAVCSFLRQHKLDSAFSEIISGDDVPRAKPAPDIYAAAARDCGANTLVVEDSPMGLKAAEAAGLGVIHFDQHGTTESPPDLCVPALRCSSGDELRHILLHLVQSEIRGEVTRFELTRAEGITPVADAAARELWERHRKKYFLHNGRICYLMDYSQKGDTLMPTVSPGEYRAFYTGRILGRTHPIPLGVSAVCMDSAGKLVWGRRKAVTQYAGFWELVPSGSIDITGKDLPDPAHNIIRELREETGISAEMVDEIIPLGLIFDTRENGADLCFALRLRRPFDPQNAPYSEYASFQCTAGLHPPSAQVVPASWSLLMLLQRRGLFTSSALRSPTW
ncbi:MAG: HAD-IA family hydrolase [Fibrobacterota bacterium]